MALASTVTVVDITRRRKRKTIQVTPSGNYVAGGDTIDLTATTNPSFLAGAGFGSVPKRYIACRAPGGYTAEYIPGATLATCKVKYYSAAGQELAAGAYPAALTGDVTEVELSTALYSEM